ncbi:hypothetical protein DL95DRAFT_459559 [Leptodontidium sp. 2 PMI_412]|nr:hypothetical protein DL95DRAFT_459559 [Leptodontidium sp. 2 PMI_412]
MKLSGIAVVFFLSLATANPMPNEEYVAGLVKRSDPPPCAPGTCGIISCSSGQCCCCPGRNDALDEPGNPTCVAKTNAFLPPLANLNDGSYRQLANWHLVGNGTVPLLMCLVTLSATRQRASRQTRDWQRSLNDPLIDRVIYGGASKI